MPNEFKPQSLDDIARGILDSGISPEQFIRMLGATQQGIESGAIRTDLSCWEHMQHFFNMALRMYVENDGLRDDDVEIGIHEATCKSPLCHRMEQAYFELLKPSTDEESTLVLNGLVELAKELFIGEERTDLKGTLCGFFDSDTGDSLLTVKVVDITPKCVFETGDEAYLVYFNPVKGMMVDIQKRSKGDVLLQVAYRLNSNIFTPTDPVFHRTADMFGIDEQFFHTIIRVNAPQSLRDGNVINIPSLLG